jgi:NADH-quinone oxidoreductase subunit I
MSALALFRTLGVSLRNVFRPMTTEPFPWEKRRVRSERYRASFALVHDAGGEEACIGCQLCEKICPSNVITVVPGGKIESPVTGKKRGTASDFTLDLNACIICELCVQVCPTDAIVMLREPATVGFSREDLLLTMERLYANEKAQVAAWSTGTGLIAMQAPSKPAEKAP